MLFTDVIRKKRDGGELDAAEIGMLVDGLADGSLPAEQVSAMAMAIFLNSMTFGEAARLTRAMAASGTVLDWSGEGLDGPVVDKHSTGGVGDKVSFMLAPIAAACGCYVPMISGRGLGHTGGTLDKVGGIPGYNPIPDLATLKKVVKTVGCAIIGQTSDLAPADRRFYAIRDVTGTVESVPLITASILSKKIAAGLDALVMDVKAGSGAFMDTLDKARELAASITATANEAGLRTHAIITDMNETLGQTAGNAIELTEAMRYLRNEQREARLDEVVVALCAEMLIAGGITNDRADARTRVEQSIVSGTALEVFGRMVSALGGPADFTDRFEQYLPMAPLIMPVWPESEGYLSGVNARAVGNAVIELGGGRRTISDELDLSVGFSDIAPIGARVGRDRPLAMIHAADEKSASAAVHTLRAGCTIGTEPPASRPVIYETIGPERAG
jgi:thymidine phosphorylase